MAENKPITGLITRESLAVMTKVVIPQVVVTAFFNYLPVFIGIIAARMYYKDADTFKAQSDAAEPTTFDFIVVGGGSAGAVLATRLSESHRVLLLEAGGDPLPLTSIPGIAYALVHDKNHDWGYHLAKQNKASLAIKVNSHYPRGKSLGGTSNLNWMIYMRGNPNDFDNWADVAGDPRWKYENVEPFFKKLENYEGHWAKSGYHGTDGPMHVEKVGSEASQKTFLKAAEDMGMEIRDLNERQREGFSAFDVSQWNGSRWGTFQGYLKPNLKRPSLTIYRYAQVTKILLDENKKAYGVSYVRHGVSKTANCSKEVIISCGSIGSPHLLLLSGIGPQKQLEDHKIKPILNLAAVGQNLQDHLMTMFGPVYFNVTGASYMLERDFTLGMLAEYLLYGKGTLSAASGLNAVGLVASSKATKEWPDIVYHLGNVGNDGAVGNILDAVITPADPHLMSKYYKRSSNAGKDSNTVAVILGRPKSRGSVTLKSNDPFEAPLIDPNYLSDEEGHDLQVLLEGVEFLIKMFETTPTYQSLGTTLHSVIFPGCEEFQFKTKPYWQCFLKQLTMTIFHPGGTCAMGKPDDPKSVVDSQLRVIGATGLRVADASIMPFITNTNTAAPTMMIGEMASHMILETWKSATTAS